MSLWPNLCTRVVLFTTLPRKGLWPLEASTSLSLRHFDFDFFFFLRQPRYVHFHPYSRFFLWSHWRPGTRHWPRPSRSWGTLAWPTTRWLSVSLPASSGAQMGGEMGSRYGLKANPSIPWFLPFHNLSIPRNSQGGERRQNAARAGIHISSLGYVFRTSHMPGPVLGIRNTAVKKSVALWLFGACQL